MKRFVDRLKDDGVAYSPLVGLPMIAIFLSATGHGTALVTYACIASFAALALLFLMIRADRPSRLHSIMSAIAALIVVTIALTHWPLRVGFSLAEARLNEIAEKAESGASVDGEWAGWFTVTHGWVDGRGVVLDFINGRFNYSALIKSSREDIGGFRLSHDWYLVDQR